MEERAVIGLFAVALGVAALACGVLELRLGAPTLAVGDFLTAAGELGISAWQPLSQLAQAGWDDVTAIFEYTRAVRRLLEPL